MKQRRFIFTVNERSPLIIYEHPEKDTKYVIGIDTGGGVGLDNTCGAVLSCRPPFEQCAMWTSNRITPADAAGHLADVGFYYNNAYAVVESNTIGAGLLDVMLKHCGYRNFYRREELLDIDPHISDKVGWATTQTTKQMLCVQFQQLFRDRQIILHDKDTIEEFCSYVYLKQDTWNPNRILKTGAIQGAKDDRVVAVLLAMHAALLNPQAPRVKKLVTNLTEDQAKQRRLLREYVERLEKQGITGNKERIVV